jgi:hypothetical protein
MLSKFKRSDWICLFSKHYSPNVVAYFSKKVNEDGGQDLPLPDFLELTLKPKWQPTILHL